MSERCTGTTAAGRPCRAWAVRGTDPPRCSAHGGRRTGAAVEEPVATEEAAAADALAVESKIAALSEQIAELDARIACLGEYMDGQWKVVNVRELCLLLDLYSKMLERVTRMRRARQALGGTERELDEALKVVLEAIDGEGTKT